MIPVITLLILICVGNLSATSNLNIYNSMRQKIIRDEALLAVGGAVTLTDAEETVNECLMIRKFHEADFTFDNPKYLNFSHHYFTYKDYIQYSKVYQIIKAMPKGAALHVHDMALLGPDYLLNITYMKHLYVCFEQQKVKLIFSNTQPSDSCDVGWQLMEDARKNASDVHQFDKELRTHFTIVRNDPNDLNPDINEIWHQFINYFITVTPMLTYRPIWEMYFYDALKTFREDKIMYVEVRSILPALYELDGTTFDEVVTAKAYRKAILRFKHDYPDFIGAKLIYAPSRLVSGQTVEHYISIAKTLKQEVREIFAGFDLVGQEDKGGPLIDFLPVLLENANELNYYFHAGETNWYGTSSDENLIDAILLGAKRLGHAYALSKHPVLIQQVKDKGIGLEVNVISNAVLALVHDVRNHPLATYLAKGLPVVLSSDDPGVWEAEPLSHDFYVTFQGVASKMEDLRLLKTLAENSLRYSALNDTEKRNALDKFNEDWHIFIENFVCFP